MGRASVFENRKWVPLFAGSAALSWACAFPLIKLGLADFGIAGTDTGGKALFAGARFLLAGLVVLAVAKLCGRSFAVPRGKTRWQLVLFGLVNTALHYFFFYLGVSNSPGGRASILDSLGTFLLILAAAVGKAHPTVDFWLPVGVLRHCAHQPGQHRRAVHPLRRRYAAVQQCVRHGRWTADPGGHPQNGPAGGYRPFPGTGRCAADPCRAADGRPPGGCTPQGTADPGGAGGSVCRGFFVLQSTAALPPGGADCHL